KIQQRWTLLRAIANQCGIQRPGCPAIRNLCAVLMALIPLRKLNKLFSIPVTWCWDWVMFISVHLAPCLLIHAIVCSPQNIIRHVPTPLKALSVLVGFICVFTVWTLLVVTSWLAAPFPSGINF